MNDIGKILQNARNEKHYTLDDLQQITKIQKRYLIAIEENNFNALPGDFYVRAFIRQYADTVGVDSAPLLVELDEQKNNNADLKSDENENQAEIKTRTEIGRQQKNDTMNSQMNRILGKFMNRLPMIIIVGVVVIILGSIYFVMAGNKKNISQSSENNVSVSMDVSSSSKKSTKKKESNEESKNNSHKKSSSEKDNAKGQKITNTAVNSSRFTYTLKTSSKNNEVKFTSEGGTAWSSISVNGLAKWQGTLSSGAEHTVNLPEGTSSFVINLGNSNVTKIMINGKKFDFLKENSTLTVRQLTVNIEE